MFSSAFAVFTVSELHFTLRSYKFKQLLFLLNRNQCTSYCFIACRVLWSITAFVISSHVGLRQWTDSGIQSFCPTPIFRTYYNIFSVHRWGALLPYRLNFLQATTFVRLSVIFYPTLLYRNSHVVLSHIHRSQSQRWINATFITQLLSSNCTIQESWGEFSDEADS